MWTCGRCGEKLEDQFDSCWKCSGPRTESHAESAVGTTDSVRWKLQYKIFRGTLATWDELFARAAYFASELGPERVLSISHSADDGDGVVTVWHWSPENASEKKAQE